MTRFCLCVCLSQVGVLSKQLDGSSCFWHGVYPPLVLHCFKGIRVSLEISVLAGGTSSQTLNLADFLFFSPRCVNRRKSRQLCSTVSSLSHGASTFVYHTKDVTQSVVRFVSDSWQLALETDEPGKARGSALYRKRRCYDVLRTAACCCCSCCAPLNCARKYGQRSRSGCRMGGNAGTALRSSDGA